MSSIVIIVSVLSFIAYKNVKEDMIQ